MNKVNVDNCCPPNRFKEGDLFRRCENVYILAMINKRYALINVATGWSWDGSHDTIGGAVGKATFIGRNMNIKIC